MAMILAAFFNLNAVASIGSAVALVVFTLISIGHVRVHNDTGAKVWILVAAIAATSIVFVTFALTTLVHEPATIVVIAVVVVLSIAIDVIWKRSHTGAVRGGPAPVS
jgi:hypothetical protein